MPSGMNKENELEQLQLEEAREVAMERKTRRDARLARVQAIEATLKRDKQNQEHIQSICMHRKGGKASGGIYAGNDANYAVVTHHLSHGGTICICQRCSKVWRQPDPLPARATDAEKARWKTEMEEYRRARNFPTDNEPSGNAIFSFSRPGEEYS